MAPLSAWAAQQLASPAGREMPCRLAHPECARRVVPGRSTAFLGSRTAGRRAEAKASRSSVRCAAAVDAPARSTSTSRMLVDLAVQNLPLSFGAGVRAVGSCVELGNWNVEEAPECEWAEGDNWHKQLILPSGQHDFKLVIIEPNGELTWEQGGDRKAQVPEDEEEDARLQLSCRFSDTASTGHKGKSASNGAASNGAARPAVVAQAAATEAPPKPAESAPAPSGSGSEPTVKNVPKESDDDGSVTFTFPKGYRFEGGAVQDGGAAGDAADAGAEEGELDEYEAGDIVVVEEDTSLAQQREEMAASYKPKYSDAQVAEMDQAYGAASGGDSQGAFNFAKLADGAKDEGWTMSDEYDAPSDEYGDDRADADKDEPDDVDWTQDGAGSPIDYNDPGDFDLSDE